MADKKRLVALSEYLAQGTGDDGQDLLQTAKLRWLKSKSVQNPTPQAAATFLRGAMYSVRYNRVRQIRLQKSELGNRLVPATIEAPDPVEEVRGQPDSAEDTLFAQQLFDLFGDDLELQAYLLGRLSRSSRAHIQEDNKWDDRKYDAVQKRFSRMMVSLQLKGALP